MASAKKELTKIRITSCQLLVLPIHSGYCCHLPHSSNTSSNRDYKPEIYSLPIQALWKMKNSQGNKDRSWTEPFNIFFWDKLCNNTYKTCITKWIRKDLVLDLCKYVVSKKKGHRYEKWGSNEKYMFKLKKQTKFYKSLFVFSEE